MFNLLKLSAITSLTLGGAIFGFFYAWICSTMWGLDATDPRIAIAAMQAMNASVRNAIFAPAFFGTAPIMIITGIIAFSCHKKAAAIMFIAAGIIYFIGGNVLTFSINVQMNEALALVKIPQAIDEAHTIWQAYSQKWQFWNQIRTIASGISLLLIGLAIMQIGQKSEA
ncbi:DUF1772 domain-containing protein [Lentilitoribacter sp. EG35]|uniref:anthrone oxygenase family protein n=1 Tax=Lentilitoribacter sp. EG35 TaxID=3234192 RepID=UPI003460FDFF